VVAGKDGGDDNGGDDDDDGGDDGGDTASLTSADIGDCKRIFTAVGLLGSLGGSTVVRVIPQ